MTNSRLKFYGVFLGAVAFVGASILAIRWVAIEKNYPIHRQLEYSIVRHPEFIPTAEAVRIGSIGMESLVADMYWLRAIQYIGSNALSAGYKAYLATMLELITDLSPHFTYPYQIWMLLLPDVNERYETMGEDERKRHIAEAIQLGKKGIEKNCSQEKITAISGQFNLKELNGRTDLREPCTDPMIPYYLGYVSYWNNHDPESAALWYRVAGMHENAPKGAVMMSAIMQGKTGNREKAIVMFLSLAENFATEKDGGVCLEVTGQLKQLLIPAFDQGVKLTPEFLRRVEEARVEAKRALGEKQEEIERTDISAYCSSYLDKSVREMNLQYIQDADERFFEREKRHASDAKELLNRGYISYLPRDYQKESDGYEVVYVYDSKTERWDFEMGKYPN